MANKIYWSKTALIGGTADALDSIDGAGLTDGDFAHVVADGKIYIYKLDDDSGATESSPGVITPDANAGTKRWILAGERTTEVTEYCTTDELSQLHESGVVKADLVKLHDITSSATEINQLHESGVVKADLEKLHSITEPATLIDAAADLLDPTNRAVGDLLTETSAGTMGAIAAGALGTFLKGKGSATLPAWEKMSLSDTGVSFGMRSITSTGNVTITTGFNPSVVIFFSKVSSTQMFGVDDGTNACCFSTEEGGTGSFTEEFSIRHAGFGGGVQAEGKITAKSSTGLTITFTKVEDDIRLIYLALP